MRALTDYVENAGLAYVFAKTIFGYASAIQTSLIAFGLHKFCSGESISQIMIFGVDFALPIENIVPSSSFRFLGIQSKQSLI